MVFIFGKNLQMDKSIHTYNYKRIISFLRQKREEAGVTQEELSERLRVNQSFISKVETCERRLDIVELMMICKKLNLSFVDFVTEIENIINFENE